MDDPEGGIYYTIQMPDGRDKQTLETALQSMENQVAIYTGDSDSDDAWEAHFSPQGHAFNPLADQDEGQIDNFFPMPMAPGGPVFGTEDYPEEWGSPDQWDATDDVQAGVMSPQQMTGGGGEELSLEELRNIGRRHVYNARQSGDSVDWRNINEVPRTICSVFVTGPRI